MDKTVRKNSKTINSHMLHGSRAQRLKDLGKLFKNCMTGKCIATKL
jgi:hypothetical protein